MFTSCTARALPCRSHIRPHVNPSDTTSIVLVPEEPQRMKMPQRQHWSRAKSDEIGWLSTMPWCASLTVSPQEQALGEPRHMRHIIQVADPPNHTARVNQLNSQPGGY